jgi:hypothetical protein
LTAAGPAAFGLAEIERGMIDLAHHVSGEAVCFVPGGFGMR